MGIISNDIKISKMTKRNAAHWHWYTNSYPTNKGIHFSFRTINFALRFMRRFKTMPFELSTQYHYDENYVLKSQGITTYAIKILEQKEPTEEQYSWLKRCKHDKKEKQMTFEEFKRGYKIYQGPKPKEGKHEAVWYIVSLDYSKGKGYYAYADDEKVAIWSLKHTFECQRNRGEL